MTTIDKSKPVLVTGATGYIAGWIIKKLLEEGLTVHAAVRNPADSSKLEHLSQLAAASSGIIRYFKSDLLKLGSYAEAMQGCELVYHTASPYTLNVKDPQKELITPAVEGTRNVLDQACKTPSVKRVVLTSSCAAIYTDAIETVQAPGGMLTEEIWNTTASPDYQPYSYSKTLAERKAWEIANMQNQWDLIVLNPAGVFGPALNPGYTTSESITILKQMGDGTLKRGVPNVGIGIVDVRDLAQAHYEAGFRPQVSGRYIIAGHNSSLLQMSQVLYEHFGNQFPIGNSAAPKWLLMLIGPLVNKALSRRFVKKNVNVPWSANNTKGKTGLGLHYRPLRETLIDSFQMLIDHHMLPGT